MAATLHDIARLAGLSISTVSRVLNGKADEYHIREETRKVVFETARTLNYRPNPLARGLRMQKTSSLGLVVPDVSNPFFAHITRRIQDVAYQLGYSLIVCNTNENVNLEIEHLELLNDSRVDGLIVMPVGQSFDHLNQLVDGGAHLVIMDRASDDVRAHCVVLDNFRAGYLGAEYLIRHHHRRIGLLMGLSRTYTNGNRLLGFQAAHEQFGVPLVSELITGGSYQEESGYAAMTALLSLDEPPTAVFATGSLLALGVYRAVLERGLRIPEDISVLTMDDFGAAPFLACPLTAVTQPREAMAESAVHLLVDHIENHHVTEPRRVVFTPHLVERKSVRTL